MHATIERDKTETRARKAPFLGAAAYWLSGALTVLPLTAQEPLSVAENRILEETKKLPAVRDLSAGRVDPEIVLEEDNLLLRESGREPFRQGTRGVVFNLWETLNPEKNGAVEAFSDRSWGVRRVAGIVACRKKSAGGPAECRFPLSVWRPEDNGELEYRLEGESAETLYQALDPLCRYATPCIATESVRHEGGKGGSGGPALIIREVRLEDWSGARSYVRSRTRLTCTRFLPKRRRARTLPERHLCIVGTGYNYW